MPSEVIEELFSVPVGSELKIWDMSITLPSGGDPRALVTFLGSYPGEYGFSHTFLLKADESRFLTFPKPLLLREAGSAFVLFQCPYGSAQSELLVNVNGRMKTSP
jgi:hypothetical protein